MEYISTFDAVFAFFIIVLVACFIVAFGGACISDKKGKLDAWNAGVHRHRIEINAGWLLLLIVGAFNSPAGTTTFLTLCFAIGTIAAIWLRWKKRDDVPGHDMMVDLSGYIREELNGKTHK